MAIDIAGFITYLKDHAVEHGFHVHDERHFIETYSLRQSWEVDLHPESACNGPLDLNLAFDVEPRVLLDLEDKVDEMHDEFEEPEGDYMLPLSFNWALPPLGNPPDLIILGAELAGVAGSEIPIDVSAVDSIGALESEAAAASQPGRPHPGQPGGRDDGPGLDVRHARPLPGRLRVPGRAGRQLGCAP